MNRPSNSQQRIWGLDVGGANIKFAEPVTGRAEAWGFELWRNPTGLGDFLAQRCGGRMEPTDSSQLVVALTMTGELCDCFASRADGVATIVNEVARGLPNAEIAVYGWDGTFRTSRQAVEEWRWVAAANWHATAAWAAQRFPRGILVDLGSTTTDLIPFGMKQVLAVGTSDWERLQNFELLYLGLWRTPVSAVLPELHTATGRWGLSPEWFASLEDVYLYLGLAPLATRSTCGPADGPVRCGWDGQPLDRSSAARRLARLLCSDLDELPREILDALCHQTFTAHRRRFHYALQGVLRTLRMRTGETKPSSLVIAGSGDWWLEQRWQEWQRDDFRAVPELRDWTLQPLTERPERRDVAAAWAVAELWSSDLAATARVRQPQVTMIPRTRETPAELPSADSCVARRVIKLGGSLLTWPKLPETLANFLRELSDSTNVLVVGGGALVDVLRGHSSTFSLPDIWLHSAAIQLMDLQGELVRHWLPDAATYRCQTEILQQPGAVGVWICRDWGAAHPDLAVGWGTTSDTLAAALAVELAAEELILLKSTDVVAEAPRPGELDEEFANWRYRLRRVRCVNLRTWRPQSI